MAKVSNKSFNPPTHFSPEEKVVWSELASTRHRLIEGSDPWIVEIACRLMAQMRKEGIGGRYGLTTGQVSVLAQLLTTIDPAAKLTIRDVQVLEFVERYQEKHGRRPTIEQIADELKMASSQAAKHLRKLEKVGEIKLLYVKTSK